MLLKKNKNNKYFYLFIFGFILLGFLTVKSYISNQYKLSETKYNFLVEKIKKEKIQYWNIKSKVDIIVDSKLKKNKKIKKKLKKVNNKDIVKVVFDE